MNTQQFQKNNKVLVALTLMPRTSVTQEAEIILEVGAANQKSQSLRRSKDTFDLSNTNCTKLTHVSPS